MRRRARCSRSSGTGWPNCQRMTSPLITSTVESSPKPTSAVESATRPEAIATTASTTL